MAILGAHLSIAGGYHRAVEKAQQIGCDCVQLFTKNNNQWRAKAITPTEAERFKAAVGDLGIAHLLAHDAYLINLASPDPDLWRRSVDAFVEELHRAAVLGIPYLVTHPGAYTTGSESEGLRRIRAFHLNDSRRELGSRVDRHEHIGRGKLGPEPFRLLLADRRFRRTPMYLETPKGQRNGTDWDVVNLRTLRRWAASRRPR